MMDGTFFYGIATLYQTFTKSESISVMRPRRGSVCLRNRSAYTFALYSFAEWVRAISAGNGFCCKLAKVIFNTESEIAQMYSFSNGQRNMTSPKQHPPVILLLGKRTGKADRYDEWLASSRYSACEASDVFHALEHLSDFTTEHRPDVVFVHVDSRAADRAFVQSLVATTGDTVVPIIDLASGGPTDNPDEVMAGLASQLDKFIPQHSSARA